MPRGRRVAVGGSKATKHGIRRKRPLADKRTFKPMTSGGGLGLAQYSPFPRQKMCKLIYQDTGYLTTVAVTGLPGVHSYRVNSVYDPDFTGVGHQPQFRDQLAAVYSRYIVYGVRYHVTFTLPGNYAWKVGILATEDTTYNPATHSFDVSSEKRGCVQAIMGKEGSPGSVKTMSGFIKASKLAGLTPKEYNADKVKYGGVVGANPTNDLYMTLIGETITVDASVSLAFTIRLQYYVKFYAPKVVGQS